MTGYRKIKALVKTATDKTLLEMFSKIETNENTGIEELVVINAIESELEDRGLIQFNEETWEYELTA